MKKSMKKGICLAGIVALSLFSGAMTSYAIGPGEVSQTVVKPITYNQQSVRALGNWEQQGSTWKFKCLDGSYLSNSWVESLSEVGAYYFIGIDGTMLINNTTSDGYQVDANGLWRATQPVQENTNNGDNSSSDDGLQEYIDYLNELKESGFQFASSYGGIS